MWRSIYKGILEANNCEYKGYDIQDLDLEKDKLPDSDRQTLL